MMVDAGVKDVGYEEKDARAGHDVVVGSMEGCWSVGYGYQTQGIILSDGISSQEVEDIALIS